VFSIPPYSGSRHLDGWSPKIVYTAAVRSWEAQFMGHGLEADVRPAGSGERIGGFGGDEILVRLQTAGDDPLAVIEDATGDTEPAPLHSHPWDELIYVLEGEMSLTCGDSTATGGPGTLATLPRGVPHTLHVTRPPARFLMITVGAPSAAFIREVGEAYAAGPSRERLLEIASRHGVTPHF
jgi:mannose-6-phosphate isomerase-like protein (cupin superfamily)